MMNGGVAQRLFCVMELGCTHNSPQRLAVLGRAVAKPSCDAFCRATVEVGQSHWRHANSCSLGLLRRQRYCCGFPGCGVQYKLLMICMPRNFTICISALLLLTGASTPPSSLKSMHNLHFADNEGEVAILTLCVTQLSIYLLPVLCLVIFRDPAQLDSVMCKLAKRSWSRIWLRVNVMVRKFQECFRCRIAA